MKINYFKYEVTRFTLNVVYKNLQKHNVILLYVKCIFFPNRTQILCKYDNTTSIS